MPLVCPRCSAPFDASEGGYASNGAFICGRCVTALEVSAQEQRVAESLRAEGASEDAIRDELTLADPYASADAKKQAGARNAVRWLVGVLGLVAYVFFKAWLRRH